MNVYVAEEFIELKDELKNRGYNIVEDNNLQCDAIICDLKNCNLTDLNIQGSIKREGTLIIDKGCKTIEDIDYILNNRVYSSLF